MHRYFTEYILNFNTIELHLILLVISIG
ncbi:hypothetical protein YPPY54_4114, partial [Yersinia pestis PY-54]